MAVGRGLSVMITGTGRKSWGQVSRCIIWMFRIPNYIAGWKNEIETSLKARLKFPKGKWIDTSLFSNRRPETSLYKKLHLKRQLPGPDRSQTPLFRSETVFHLAGRFSLLVRLVGGRIKTGVI